MYKDEDGDDMKLYIVARTNTNPHNYYGYYGPMRLVFNRQHHRAIVNYIFRMDNF